MKAAKIWKTDPEESSFGTDGTEELYTIKYVRLQILFTTYIVD